MPSPKSVTITIESTTQPTSPAAIVPVLLKVSEQPVQGRELDEGNGHDNGNAKIHWKIEDHTGKNWRFTSKGIVIDDATLFTDKGQAGDKHHIWQRERKDKGTHKYTINVTNGTDVVSWDPTIMND
jgi:hypothetical protein